MYKRWVKQPHRREQIREIKRYLSDTMNKHFAGKKPTIQQATLTLQRVLKSYPLPPHIGVRLNRVHDVVEPIKFDIEIFNPMAEARKAMMKRLTDMTPEETLLLGRRTGKSITTADTIADLIGAPAPRRTR